MREFTGAALTVYELMRAMQKGEVIVLVLGRSGVLRLYILPLSWAEKLETLYEGWTIDDAKHVSVDDLSKEAVTGQILMEQGSAVITVSRGVPQAILVPANRYWKALVEPETDGN